MGAFPGTMLVLLLQAWLLQASAAEFLTPVLDHGNANLPLCQQETVVSCTLVKIDQDSLDASTVAFMGATLDFLDQPGDNTYTFSSEDGAEASFTVDLDLGAVWGHAQLADGRDFIIEPDLDNCEGCHVVIEEDQGAFPHDLAETPPPLSGEETRSNAALLDMGKTDSTTLVTYSIMLYYTPEVKAAVDDVRLMADQVIATTNQGYINSEIPLRAVLHCIEETNEPESAFTLDNRDQGRLGYFRQYKDGGNSLRSSADAAVSHRQGRSRRVWSRLQAPGCLQLRRLDGEPDRVVLCSGRLHLRPRARSQHGSRPRQVCRCNQEHPLLTGLPSPGHKVQDHLGLLTR